MKNFVLGRRVLVLGGTGAIGRYLVPELATMGASVFVTSRLKRTNGQNVTYVQGDAHDPCFLKMCVDTLRPDAIVDFMNYSTGEFFDRAQFLVEASGHYLFLSSYRVFADNNPLTEMSPRLLDVSTDSDFLKTDIYPLAKARQEDILKKSHGGEWTIVRPCITYSSERFQFGCLEANTVCFRSFQNVPVIIPSLMLDKKTTMTWGGDVGKMVSRLVLNPASCGESYNVVTSETHTWREVAEVYARLIGLKYIETGIEDYVRVIGEHYRYQTIYDRMFDRVLDNTKILAATGLEHDDFMDLQTGLAKELARFQSHPYYPFLNLPENVRMDRFCGCQIKVEELTEQDRKIYRELYNDAK